MPIPQDRHRYLAPAVSEGRVERSWRLTRSGWDVLRTDRTLLVLAALSLLVTMGVAGGMLWLAGGFRELQWNGRLFWVPIAASWPAAFVSTYLSVALAGAANEALAGHRLSLREALRISRRRVLQIAAWSLLASVVGVLLRELVERLPFGGKVAGWLAGATWTLATIFVVPILALEGCAAPVCVKRSARLVKQRWGEGIVGELTIAAWAGIAYVPAGVVLMIGVGAGGVAGAVLIAIALAALAVVVA